MPRAQLAEKAKNLSPAKRGAGKIHGREKNIDEVRSRGLINTMQNVVDIDPDKPPSEKQRAFAKFFAQGETVMTAMVRAGFADTSATYGYRLVRQPNILKIINEEKAKYEAACQMTRKRVMDGLLEGVELAKLAGEPASVITGWKTIGQMCGYFEPIRRKIDINVTGNVMLDRMNRLTDAELLKLIQDGVTADLEAIEDAS